MDKRYLFFMAIFLLVVKNADTMNNYSDTRVSNHRTEDVSYKKILLLGKEAHSKCVLPTNYHDLALTTNELSCSRSLINDINDGRLKAVTNNLGSEPVACHTLYFPMFTQHSLDRFVCHLKYFNSLKKLNKSKEFVLNKLVEKILQESECSSDIYGFFQVINYFDIEELVLAVKICLRDVYSLLVPGIKKNDSGDFSRNDFVPMVLNKQGFSLSAKSIFWSTIASGLSSGTILASEVSVQKMYKYLVVNFNNKIDLVCELIALGDSMSSPLFLHALALFCVDQGLRFNGIDFLPKNFLKYYARLLFIFTKSYGQDSLFNKFIDESKHGFGASSLLYADFNRDLFDTVLGHCAKDFKESLSSYNLVFSLIAKRTQLELGDDLLSVVDPHIINCLPVFLQKELVGKIFTQSSISSGEVDRFLGCCKKVSQKVCWIKLLYVCMHEQFSRTVLKKIFNKIKRESICKMLIRFIYFKNFGETIDSFDIEKIVSKANKQESGKKARINLSGCFSGYTSSMLIPYLENIILVLGGLYDVDVKRLVLRKNKFEKLPEALFKLTFLEHLDVSSNELKSISTEIGSLKNLTYLDISGNEDLEDLPDEIGMLQKLEALKLKYLNFNTLPLCVCNLLQLKKLNLQHTFNINICQIFPEELMKLKNLEVLNISEAVIDIESESVVWKLKGLKKLKMNHCYIEEIPAQIGNLTSLEVLELYENEITELPEEMVGLSYLKKVNISGNKEDFEDINISEVLKARLGNNLIHD